MKLILKPHDHVLFIGDSITHAHRRPEEHHDCYSLGCGYAKMVAAALNADQPALKLRFSNRGECGDGTADLLRRWETDCLALTPDVVSILIGINDAHPDRTHNAPEQFADRYDRLLKQTRAAVPKVRLVLIEPFGLWVAPEASPVSTIDRAQLDRVREYGPLVAHLARTHDAVSVHMQSCFDKAAELGGAGHYAIDGVHPSAAGHLLIARNWLHAAGVRASLGGGV